jgi:hypothetical protein
MGTQVTVRNIPILHYMEDTRSTIQLVARSLERKDI